MFRGLKKVIVGIVIFTLVFAGLVPIGRTVNAATYSGYIMAYFKQATGEYGLNLCYSTDGLNWKNINDGKPVLYAQLGTKGIRDPYIYRKQDGEFVIVATDMLGTNWGDHSQYIHLWESPDLIRFNNERLLKVHSTNMHAWAPEVFYDYNKKQYGIYWSGNTDYNRTYVNYTTDFKTLTDCQVFFDPGYDVIDSSIRQHNGTAYLFFKDERSSGKSIKAAKSTTLNPNSFSVFTPSFITSAGTEGPFVFKDNNSDTWYLYADLYNMGGVFECWKTTDLNATKWTKVTNISVPPGVRHGSVVSVTQAELDAIIAGKPAATATKIPTATPTVTPSPTAISYDLNGDGAINIADVMLLASVFNTSTGDSKYIQAYDLNRDGAINISDVMLIATKFNTKV